MLEDSAISACEGGQALILGELNARTGAHPDYPEWQQPEETAMVDLPPTATQRRSQDTATTNGPRSGSVVDYAICCPRLMARAVASKRKAASTPIMRPLRCKWSLTSLPHLLLQVNPSPSSQG